jgi:RNA polymerase sigma-70 factor (ECF subfamily)
MTERASGFDELYRAHHADVRRFVYHMTQSASLADELTQETFVKAYEASDSFRGDAPARIWLLRIARNTCLDYLRSPRAREARLPSLDDGPGDAVMMAEKDAASTEETVQRAQMSACVQEFVLDLPETLRSALVLHDVEGFTNAQAAQVLGVSLEAAKARLHRARARLRAMMEANCDLFHDERNVLSCLPAAPPAAAT